MKKMTKIALLLAMLAVGNSAQAQARYLKANQPYTFNGTAALGTGAMSYQWFRNGEAIPNATGESYTMPASLARGADVEIMRGVVSTACPLHISYTNRFVITFVNCLTVGGVCWATANVDAYQTFASRPDMYTAFYQWNRIKDWPATGDISGWNSSYDNSATWATANDPCPTGWRIPTQPEMQALYNMGYSWVNAGVRGAAVAGSFFGPNRSTPASCTLPNNMTDCIFLPATGYRLNSSGVVEYDNLAGYSWCNAQLSSTDAYRLRFDNTAMVLTGTPKSYGLPIRCVQTVN